MASFQKQKLTVNGIESVILTAGKGPPLVFLHGAGTFMGFDWALNWADQAQVVVPYHPNFGESGNAPGFDDMHDYVMHCLEVFDALKLTQFDLVGQSMGGWMAARFASQHPERVRRLVLACPAGLRVPEHPGTDLFTIKPEQLPGYLAADPSIIVARMPKTKDVDFLVQRYREQAAIANLVWEHPFDRKLGNWLHRLTMPTLILWGAKDRLIPPGQAKAWAKLIPGAKVKTVPGAGHLMFDETETAVREVARFMNGRQ